MVEERQRIQRMIDVARRERAAEARGVQLEEQRQTITRGEEARQGRIEDIIEESGAFLDEDPSGRRVEITREEARSRLSAGEEIFTRSRAEQSRLEKLGLGKLRDPGTKVFVGPEGKISIIEEKTVLQPRQTAKERRRGLPVRFVPIIETTSFGPVGGFSSVEEAREFGGGTPGTEVVSELGVVAKRRREEEKVIGVTPAGGVFTFSSREAAVGAGATVVSSFEEGRRLVVAERVEPLEPLEPTRFEGVGILRGEEVVAPVVEEPMPMAPVFGPAFEVGAFEEALPEEFFMPPIVERRPVEVPEFAPDIFEIQKEPTVPTPTAAGVFAKQRGIDVPGALGVFQRKREQRGAKTELFSEKERAELLKIEQFMFGTAGGITGKPRAEATRELLQEKFESGEISEIQLLAFTGTSETLGGVVPQTAFESRETIAKLERQQIGQVFALGTIEAVRAVGIGGALATRGVPSFQETAKQLQTKFKPVGRIGVPKEGPLVGGAEIEPITLVEVVKPSPPTKKPLAAVFTEPLFTEIIPAPKPGRQAMFVTEGQLGDIITGVKPPGRAGLFGVGEPFFPTAGVSELLVSIAAQKPPPRQVPLEKFPAVPFAFEVLPTGKPLEEFKGQLIIFPKVKPTKPTKPFTIEPPGKAPLPGVVTEAVVKLFEAEPTKQAARVTTSLFGLEVAAPVVPVVSFSPFITPPIGPLGTLEEEEETEAERRRRLEASRPKTFEELGEELKRSFTGAFAVTTEFGGIGEVFRGEVGLIDVGGLSQAQTQAQLDRQRKEQKRLQKQLQEQLQLRPQVSIQEQVPIQVQEPTQIQVPILTPIVTPVVTTVVTPTPRVPTPQIPVLEIPEPPGEPPIEKPPKKPPPKIPPTIILPPLPSLPSGRRQPKQVKGFRVSFLGPLGGDVDPGDFLFKTEKKAKRFASFFVDVGPETGFIVKPAKGVIKEPDLDPRIASFDKRRKKFVETEPNMFIEKPRNRRDSVGERGFGVLSFLGGVRRLNGVPLLSKEFDRPRKRKTGRKKAGKRKTNNNPMENLLFG